MKFNQILSLVLVSLLFGCSYGCGEKEKYEEEVYEDLAPEEETEYAEEDLEYEEEVVEEVPEMEPVVEEEPIEYDDDEMPPPIELDDTPVEPEVPEEVTEYADDEGEYEPMIGEESPEEYEGVEYDDEQNYPDEM